MHEHHLKTLVGLASLTPDNPHDFYCITFYPQKGSEGSRNIKNQDLVKDPLLSRSLTLTFDQYKQSSEHLATLKWISCAAERRQLSFTPSALSMDTTTESSKSTSTNHTGLTLLPSTSTLPATPHNINKIPRQTNHLERCGQWLLSIPRDDVPVLSRTPEYATFLQAFQNLDGAHRKCILHNVPNPSESSFLQHMAVDDIILRIFEFLECRSLVFVCMTCHRFKLLSSRSAKARTSLMEGRYFLDSYMKLLRAKEQAEGVLPDSSLTVRIPLLALHRRVCVTHAGDVEFNGIYFCTGSNGNGFLFTKPRSSEWGRALTSSREALEAVDTRMDENENGEHRATRLRRRVTERGDYSTAVVNSEGEETYPGRVLRCVIGKRFSNETILWYMSKEVECGNGEIKQVFSFWSKLMVIGDASPDICRYPSQTSILSRNGEAAWQSLSSTRATNPPVVELMD